MDLNKIRDITAIYDKNKTGSAIKVRTLLSKFNGSFF